MSTIYPSRLLKRSLLADAAVSGGVGALQLAAADWLSRLLALPQPLLLDTGAFLVAYAVALLILANSRRVWPAIVMIIVLGNVGWAIACAGVLATHALPPSILGAVFLLVQAAAVLTFAALEYAGLKASAPAGATVAAGT